MGAFEILCHWVKATASQKANQPGHRQKADRICGRRFYFLTNWRHQRKVEWSFKCLNLILVANILHIMNGYWTMLPRHSVMYYNPRGTAHLPWNFEFLLHACLPSTTLHWPQQDYIRRSEVSVNSQLSVRIVMFIRRDRRNWTWPPWGFWSRIDCCVLTLVNSRRLLTKNS